MDEFFCRTEMLIGSEALERLKKKRVAVFGLGGVGGYAVEALCRSAIGALDLIDNDTVAPSNINRQIIATRDTLGLYKTEAMKRRVLSINPDCIVKTYNTFYLPQTKDEFDFSQYDYIIDAIDTITGKLTLIEEAEREGIPIISSMGAGNKMDASQFCITDIYKTHTDPLSRVIRGECKKRGIKHLKVVFSTEKPFKPKKEEGKRKQTPSSIAFSPSVCGLLIAQEVIKDLIYTKENGSL